MTRDAGQVGVRDGWCVFRRFGVRDRNSGRGGGFRVGPGRCGSGWSGVRVGSVARGRVGAGAVPGWPVAFRGSWAVAAGLVTWDVPAGPRFVRYHPDVYGRVDGEPDPLRPERAAHALVAPSGVLAGYSAATVLGADCAPRFVPTEVVARGARVRGRPVWSCAGTCSSRTRSPGFGAWGSPPRGAPPTTWRGGPRILGRPW